MTTLSFEVWKIEVSDKLDKLHGLILDKIMCFVREDNLLEDYTSGLTPLDSVDCIIQDLEDNNILRGEYNV